MRGRTTPLAVALLVMAFSLCTASFGVHAEVPLNKTPSWMTPGSYDSSDVALGDFDNDGDLDLASYGEDNIHVYENVNGELGTTAVWTSAESTGVLGRVEWADIDNDNYPELFTDEGIYDNNNGVLSTTATWTNLTFASSFEVGDVDGDGFVDLLVGELDRIELFQNSGGSIDDIPDWNTTEENWPYELALADVDNDNFEELAVGNSFGDPIRMYDNVAGSLNNVSFWNSTRTDDVGCLAWGDINNDDFPELFVCTGSVVVELPNFIYMNTAGALEDTPSWVSPVSYSTDAEFVDIEGDGDLDLAVANGYYLFGLSLIEGEEVVHLNEGGVLNQLSEWKGPNNDMSYGLDLGDVDGNGYPDLVVANHEDSNYPGRVLIHSNLGPNDEPQISSVSADPLTPEIGKESTINVTATDPNDDPLEYDFSVEAGNGTIVSVTDNSTVWLAPSVEGTYVINITVSDGRGGFDYQNFMITVVAPPPEDKPSTSLGDIWLLLLIIIVIVVIISVVVAVVVRRRRSSPPEEEEAPPPEGELPPPPP